MHKEESQSSPAEESAVLNQVAILADELPVVAAFLKHRDFAAMKQVGEFTEGFGSTAERWLVFEGCAATIGRRARFGMQVYRLSVGELQHEYAVAWNEKVLRKVVSSAAGELKEVMLKRA